jgi:hypothetical protein
MEIFRAFKCAFDFAHACICLNQAVLYRHRRLKVYRYAHDSADKHKDHIKPGFILHAAALLLVFMDLAPISKRGTKEFIISMANIMPSGKMENSRIIAARKPTSKP